MKISDKFIYKGISNNDYTNGFEYEVLSINNIWIAISNNLNNRNSFTFRKRYSFSPYIYDFFYTKEELREIRFYKLGII